MPVVLLLLAIAVLIGVVVVRYVMQQRRRDELGQFALTYGFQYSADDPFGLVDPAFRLFQQGDGRGCQNVLWGAWQGLQVREADYWYYTESSDGRGGRSREYHYFSVALTDIEATVPYVRVEKEGLLSVITSHLGFGDINLESEEFNRMFNVKAEDREFAFKLIDARMMQWLLSTQGQFGFELRGSRLLVYCRRLPPTALIPAFGTAKAFHDHIPRLVWNEYGTEQETQAPSPPAPPQAGTGQVSP